MKARLLALVLGPGLLLATATPAAAQYSAGYVLTLRGDTIRGYLRPPTAATMAQPILLRQQLSSADTEIKYPLRQLRGVSLTGGKTYVVQKLQPMLGRDTLRVLFQPLTPAGPIQLYRVQYDVRQSDASALNGSQYENVFFYLGQGHGQPVRLEASSFRPLLKSLFANCPDLEATGRFDEANLTRLITRYNACLGPPVPPRP